LAFINLKKKEVQVKVVYYGPGRGGKTTNLEFIYKKLSRKIKTESYQDSDGRHQNPRGPDTVF